jgi:uncharacterized membrane protein (UPF0127 family)
LTGGRLTVIALLGVVVAGLVAGAALWLGDGERDQPADGSRVGVRVGGEPVRAEIAAGRRARARGLAGRSALAAAEGMLFVFPSEGRRDFWMRGVEFPIDMIWIRGDRVVGVTPNARPASQTGLRLYPSAGPVDRVLEVRAGWAARRGVGRGDRFAGP